MSKLTAILLLALGFMGLQAQSSGTFTDSRDGKVYKTVKIGEQVWMAENLAYKPTSGNYWAYDNEAETAAYGYLYDWETAMNACPDGWRLPTDDEWAELRDYLGGESIASSKLKETGTSHWKSPNAEASNESGFTALPGGARLLGGSINYVGDRGNWWSATKLYPGHASSWSLAYTPNGLFMSGNSSMLGYSVRCLREEDKWNDNGILVNHLGFTTKTSKFCMLKSDRDVDFEIINATDGRQSFAGTMKVVSGDFGSFAVGDFSSLQQPGSYKVRAAGKESEVFVIDDNVYQEATRMHVNYFTKQRCGNTTLGWRGEPCHLDDGRRLDNGAHHDVSGGWHDAHDVRKWTGPTIYGMIGLYRVSEVLMPKWDTGQIVDEMRWGNQYFQKMQEPDGYMMNYVAGNDGNYWSDNIIGNDDDRPIHVEPRELSAQFNFITSQAAMARLAKNIAPEYANSCEAAARKCLSWAREQPVGSEDLASGIIAAIGMYRTFAEPAMMDLAVEYARKLIALQISSPIDDEIPIRGFFKKAPDNLDPHKHIYRGDLPFIGLCELIEEFPEHADADKWKASLRMYCYDYLVPMSKLSAFGIIPYGLYNGSDPGGNRRLGNSDYYYRYSFRDPAATRGWHVGINSLLASTGTGLVKAYKIFQDPVLLAVAQRQIDWIYGANIFNASTVTGFGHNVPVGHQVGNMQPPKTPDIIGGVMNGIAGHLKNDILYIHEVGYPVAEYWTPMVAYTMWLESELMTTAVENPNKIDFKFEGNPLVRHIYTADPSARVFDDTLYVYTSHDKDNSTNDKHFDMLDWHVFSTTDMTNWTDHGAFFGLDDINWAVKQAWAPDCVKRNGKYYFYYPVEQTKIGVAVSDNPVGGFKDALGKPLVDRDWNPDIVGKEPIDPGILIDDDGQAYMFFGCRHARYVKLKENMIELDGDIQPVAIKGIENYKDKNVGGWYGEAPWIFKRNGIYYLIYSNGWGKTATIVYATSNKAEGPYEYQGEVMAPMRAGTSHGSIVEYKDKWYIFYHDKSLSGDRKRRSVCFDEIQFSSKGKIIRLDPEKNGSIKQ